MKNENNYNYPQSPSFTSHSCCLFKFRLFEDKGKIVFFIKCELVNRFINFTHVATFY